MVILLLLVSLIKLLLYGLHTLGHGGRGSGDGIGHIKVGEDLLRHIDRVLGQSQFFLRAGQFSSLGEEVGLLD